MNEPPLQIRPICRGGSYHQPPLVFYVVHIIARSNVNPAVTLMDITIDSCFDPVVVAYYHYRDIN